MANRAAAGKTRRAEQPPARGIDVIEKFTGRAIARVPEASQEAVAAAVGRAQECFAAYSQWPAHRRAKALEEASRLIAERREDLALTISKEAGKAWRYSLLEADRAAETFKFAAEEAKRVHGETIPLDASTAGEGRLGFYLRTPIGVVAAISPFNFPLNLVAHKVAPALAMGNTVVLKPATATPLTAIKLREILLEAGLPDGALEIVIGGGSTVGNWLVADPRPAMVTFTGSPGVGLHITKTAGLKKITLELGNNGGVIIEPDADWRGAVDRCVVSAFANSGQICISLQRVYVHESIAEEFTAAFVKATGRLQVGDPTRKDCDVGPMISEEEARRAEEWIEEAVRGGAKVLAGGRRRGLVLEPTVLAGASAEMKVVCQEVFAPVVSFVTYRDFEDALRQLADTSYGLQAGVYTKDIGKALEAVKRLDFGGVMINDTPIFRVDHMPYGGNKQSGIGREGVRFAAEEMTNLRMVVIKP
ncbi:MAG: aldehyde dehydrogenase family protein [Elusimicrobia bacterium]|nr:aldehyde dehydrogenase family protein [Elusimicrobiota bacterium]